MSLDKEQTIRDFLVDLYDSYEEVKKILYEVFRDPLTILMNFLNEKLDEILDLPYNEENWKILREFLAVKSN